MLKKYHKLKLFLSLLLMILMAAGFQKNEALANTNHSVVEIMDLTGILRDENGSSIVHGKYVTRAEFARMLVQASAYSGKAGSKNSLQLFKDVSKRNKYSSYIQIAVANSYMNGYLKGRFKPDKSVTVKEAAYGMLTLLGYTKDDFKDQMTDARYIKFNELGLDKNLKLTADSKLSKSSCRVLFYNLLHAKQKSGDIYGKILGYTFDSNNRIDYQALFTAKAKGPIVTKKGWSDVLSRKLSRYTIIENNKVVSSSAIKGNSIAYYGEQANTIWIYNENVCGTIETINYNQGEPQDITIAGNTYLFDNTSNLKAQLKQNHIKKGSKAVLLLGKNDLVSHIVPINSVLANGNWKNQIKLSLSTATIYLNNTLSTADAINNEDVIYYAEELNTIWAFHKRVFGSLGDITLNEGAPDALNVSGNSYFVEDSMKIKKRLQETSLQTKMPVVLLLGWDNKVYDILTLSSTVADGSWQSKLTFSPSTGIIYKDGSVITSFDIHNNDVVYYSNELKTLWVYSSKAYGMLKSISPNASSPDSIQVAGKTYTFDVPPINSTASSSDSADNLSENVWGKRLRANGIKTGDNVVVLFGFNGSVADIIPVEKMPVTITGYVLKIETQLVKNDAQNSGLKPILTMVDTEGIIREYPCNNISIQTGMIIQVSFTNGQPAISSVGTSSGVTIPSDITTKKFATDAHILTVKNQYYSNLSVTALSDISWNTGNVLYYKYNTAGEITDLILNQVSNTFYQYGILKNIDYVTNEDDSYSMQLHFLMGDSESTMTVDNPRWNLNNGPKAVLLDNNQIQDMHNLNEVRISYISDLQANTGNNVYWIADDVAVFFYKSGKYYSGSLTDIKNFSTGTVKGYRDDQGPIRVIIVTE